MNATLRHSVLGQNKNQFVISYFMWRVMIGKTRQIEYLMQIQGHARYLVDSGFCSGFASLKKKYRRIDCNSLGQLQRFVDTSSATNETIRHPAW